MKPLTDYTQEALRKLIQLESQCYKGTCYRAMSHIRTWEEVADYCECDLDDLIIYLGEDWYAILAEHEDEVEFVDLASTQKHMPIHTIVSICLGIEKPFVMDCRENTSYRILKILRDRELIDILEDNLYTWGGESFHEVTAKTQVKNKNLAILR